jgi:hypothetical protein
MYLARTVVAAASACIGVESSVTQERQLAMERPAVPISPPGPSDPAMM